MVGIGPVPGHAVLDPFLQSNRGPEHDHPARGDWPLLAGPRIAAYAFRLSAHGKCAERRQLHRLPGGEPLQDHIQYRVHELRGFIVRQVDGPLHRLAQMGSRHRYQDP